MSRVRRYEVVDASDLDGLVASVQQRIARGWQPLGGPFYFSGSFYQAVVLSHPAGPRIEIIEECSEERQSDLELIEELTEDDEPLESWEGPSRSHGNGLRL